jgi:hypothetical protein
MREERLMTAPTHSLHRPHCRPFSVEPLEDRLLLSGLTSQPQGEHVPPPIDDRATEHLVLSDRVQLLEIGPAEDDEDAAREIPLEELPRDVISALTAHFPGAQLASAALDDDEALTFSLSAQWSGGKLELTVAPDGNVIEIEEALTPSDVPEAVSSWIASHFPGASIREVDFVAADDAASYDILFATTTDQLFEATLRMSSGVRPTVASPDFARSQSFTQANVYEATSRSADEPAFTSGAEPSNDAADPGPPATAVKTERQPGISATNVRSDQVPKHQALPATSRSTKTADKLGAGIVDDANGRPVLLSATLRPTLASIAPANPPTLLPQVAQALGDLFPLELSALERGLREFLDEVDALADSMMVSWNETSSLTPRLLIVAVVLLETQRVLNDIRKTRRERVFVAVADSATWTWGPHRVTWSNAPLR